ncbi:DUF2441 domain-containing protein [Carnimonas nigrificans]|uniref:DUF2441 domain-containing protein n=1 Tax=Carnimonas nigrificans TaxID=64323 RepID=UPI000472E8B7|nr:DUF2441 domain-containing protein [Carnimonas nigrificans]
MKKCYYTVDRNESLVGGSEIKLKQFKDITPAALQNLVDTEFPNGLSKHGEIYYLCSKAQFISPKEIAHRLVDGLEPSLGYPIDLLWEQVRRARFSEHPSRFQCIFGWETVEYAKQQAQSLGWKDKPIYEVFPSGKTFIANMSLLFATSSNLMVNHLANEYWEGNNGPEEFSVVREVLIDLPATIGKQVGMT